MRGAEGTRRDGRGKRVMMAALAAMLTTAGCASFSGDGGMAIVRDHADNVLDKEIVKVATEEQAALAQSKVRALLAKPMTVDAAVQVALLNNRGLQAAYNDLGVSEAQMVEASLPPAPTVSLSRIVGSGGFEIERQIVQNILGLATLPRRREIAEAKFRQAQLRAVDATLRTAAEARRAFYRAVAAGQTVKFLDEARASAQAVSDLAKKLGETGALSKLDQAREHAFYAEVSGQLALGRLRERAERDRLIRALGLWGGDTKFRLPPALKPLLARPKSLPDVETEAVTCRVDLEVARMELDILAKELGLTRRTRFINVLEVAGQFKSEKDSKVTTVAGVTETEVDRIKRHGLDVEFQIPIYDFGETRVRLAEETYMKAVNRLIEKAVNVRSEAREAYVGYRGAYDIARHFEKEIVPLRKIISDEMLLNYSGMIKDLFALLADSRARIAANVQSIEARRDYWLATAHLQVAIHGGAGEGGEGEAIRTAVVAGSANAQEH